MLPLIRKFKLNSSVLSIGASLDSSKRESILILDSSYHLYALRDGEFVFSKQIFDFPSQHQFSKACAVSMYGYIAIGVPKSNVCEVLKFEDDNLIHLASLSWHKADIYNIRFSRDGKYLITGGEDGKVFVFRLPDFHIACILPPRPDYISNIHFGRIAKLIVYSSYDLQNCVFDMVQNKIIGTFSTHSVVEDIVFFDNDKKIFCVCANGESGIYDIASQTLDLKQNYHTWLTRTGLTKDDNYAYIGARDNTLSYLCLDTNAVHFEVGLSYEEGISSMRIVGAKLHIGYGNGYLEIFDLSQGSDELLLAINSTHFKEAKMISDKNISLKTHKIYIEFMDKCFEREYQKAKIALQNDTSQANITKILSKLEVFFEDKSKKQKISKLLENIGIFKEFAYAISNRDYVLAYRLVDENEILKTTSEFEELENRFEEVFENAKNLLLKESFDATNEANEILKPFQAIASKKDIINKLLQNTDKFAQADLLLKNKHFEEYFKLAESFKAIQNTRNYKKALVFGEQILATINEFEANNNHAKALELNAILLKFAPLSDIAKRKQQDIHLKMEFLELCEHKNYKQIYQNIDKFATLKSLPEYIQMRQYFNQIFENALDLAIKGKNEMTYQILKDYFDIAFWQDKMASIFNLSYLNEINHTLNNAININHIDWQASLERYINMFGKNDELIKICESHAQIRDILQQIEPKALIPQYLPTILVKKES